MNFALYQQIMWISFCFSTKAIIFVCSLPFRKVFAMYDMQLDKQKPATGYFRLHRLLYFIRAVC